MRKNELTSQYKLNSTFIIQGEVNCIVREGTCFSISETEIVTAWHVVNEMDEIKVFLTTDDLTNNKFLLLKLDKHDDVLDIAILSIENGSFPEYLTANNVNVLLNLPIRVCGYPKEKVGKHAVMDTSISNIYDCIKTESHSFELKQIDTINNYRGMSGAPILFNGCVIGVLLVQQAGTSLYGVSIFDIFQKLKGFKEHFTLEPAGEPKQVLFNHYTDKIEPFYCERPEDIEFTKSLNINNLWVFGKSGVGKTAIINRNLTKNNIEYCYCDFSPIDIENEQDVLEEILECIEDKFDGNRLSSEKNKIKQINRLLCEAKTSKVVVVIDELGVDDEALLKKIADTLLKLVSYVTRHYRTDGLMFAVSTIDSPNGLLKNAGKANDYFQFLCCDSWDENLSDLFDLICLNLQISIEFMKPEIIAKAEQSPRILKSIIKNIVSVEIITEKSINIAISKSLNEAVV
jgi:hypothetical protein